MKMNALALFWMMMSVFVLGVAIYFNPFYAPWMTDCAILNTEEECINSQRWRELLEKYKVTH